MTDEAELKDAYTELVKIYLTDIPSFTLMYRPQSFHAVNESVWTGFPHEGDGTEPARPAAQPDRRLEHRGPLQPGTGPVNRQLIAHRHALEPGAWRCCHVKCRLVLRLLCVTDFVGHTQQPTAIQQPKGSVGLKGYRKYFLNKLGWFAITFVVAFVLNFILPRLMPGDPVAAIVARQAQGMSNSTGVQAIYEQYTKLFGTDKPMLEQFCHLCEKRAARRLRFLVQPVSPHGGSRAQRCPSGGP